jgi:hypothetical protein
MVKLDCFLFFIFRNLSLSLSLSIYIYIYVFVSRVWTVVFFIDSRVFVNLDLSVNPYTRRENKYKGTRSGEGDL